MALYQGMKKTWNYAQQRGPSTMYITPALLEYRVARTVPPLAQRAELVKKDFLLYLLINKFFGFITSRFG